MTGWADDKSAVKELINKHEIGYKVENQVKSGDVEFLANTMTANLIAAGSPARYETGHMGQFSDCLADEAAAEVEAASKPT